MKRFVSTCAAVAATVLLVGCGGSQSVGGTSESAPATTSSAAAGCAAGGLDAMTALADFQLEMDAAQKAGTLTTDQLIAARETLFNETQAAQDAEDWSAYCRSIDDMRVELGL